MKMEIVKIAGPLDNNSVIVRDGEKVYAFDPAGRADDWRRRGVAAAFATHAHFDHISGLAGWDAPWFMNLEDMPAFQWSLAFLPTPIAVMPLDLADAPKLGDMEIIETPGHSAGGACFYFPSEKVLIAGDTLFYDSVGRTDLPTGDKNALLKSIELLKNYGFADYTLVIPGHGRTATWGEIKKVNPFVSE